MDEPLAGDGGKGGGLDAEGNSGVEIGGTFADELFETPAEKRMTRKQEREKRRGCGLERAKERREPRDSSRGRSYLSQQRSYVSCRRQMSLCKESQSVSASSRGMESCTNTGHHVGKVKKQRWSSRSYPKSTGKLFYSWPIPSLSRHLGE